MASGVSTHATRAAFCALTAGSEPVLHAIPAVDPLAGQEPPQARALSAARTRARKRITTAPSEVIAAHQAPLPLAGLEHHVLSAVSGAASLAPARSHRGSRTWGRWLVSAIARIAFEGLEMLVELLERERSAAVDDLELA